MSTPDYRALAQKLADQYDLPWFPMQIEQESGYDPNASSPAGAKGIAQIVPKYHPGVDTSDPVASLEYAAKYMRQLVDKYHGNAAQALSVYNSGNPDAYLDPNFAKGQTYNYVRSILGHTATAAHATTHIASMPSTSSFDASTATQLTPQQQARTNLGDIASGALKPTDALAKLPALVQQATAGVPTFPTVTQSGGRAQSLDAQAVALAKKYLGVKYTWGGTSAQTGFDCSGLVQTVWKQLGKNIPRTSQQQYATGTPVDVSQLQPGDGVFFVGSDGTKDAPVHEGLYIGDGKFIEAPHTGATVRISTLQGRTDFVGARRFS